MRRLTLVIPSLTSGGAERVMTTLANGWAERGNIVTLLTFDDGKTKPFYDLDARIAHRPLAIAGASTNPVAAIFNTVNRVRVIRTAIRKSNPEVVLSFLDTTNVTVLLATRGLKIPVIVEEHTDPSQKQLGRGWVTLRNSLYPRADQVVVLSEESRAYFSESVQVRSSIIPNPIVVTPGKGRPQSERIRRTVIAIGRMGPEKGFDLLIEAFSQVAPAFPDWDLVIWGDGTLRPDLTALVARLGLESRVTMPGRTRQPHDELRKADLFVMSSRREGFPMALGEAMACGLPVISTDCPSGPRQLIRDGIDGVLVEPENPNALAASMQALMTDEFRRQAIAQRAPEVLDRFGLDRVLGVWDELFSRHTRDRSYQKSRGIRTFGSGQTGTANGTEG